jgi:hypothetical protein
LQSEPYQAPVAGQDERVRPFGLWPRLTWFVIGSVASWTASSVIGFHQGQSRDYTRSLPPSLREIAPEWLTDALAVTAGSLVMITSADSTNASALIHPVHHGSFPVMEFEVFYDKNEQHRILAEDVEDYLRPIYQSDAQYVVVLLGPEFPKRIWTKFESEQFKTRFGEGAVIPVWFKNAPPGMFDESARVGGLEYDPGLDRDTQIAHFADILRQKIAESRV